MVFPALYNAPINYYAHLLGQTELVLEQYDSYTRQSYRNRCRIMGPNGLITLSIPVIKEQGTKTLMKDVRIDYDSHWNRIHWKSLVASYASSPFFEYFRDEFFPFYDEKFTHLIELNHRLMEHTLLLLGLTVPVRLSESFARITSERDPRHYIHPKKNQAVADPGFQPQAYHQVFTDRFGFRSNLSIIDLLFNLGPEALSYLQSSLKI